MQAPFPENPQPEDVKEAKDSQATNPAQREIQPGQAASRFPRFGGRLRFRRRALARAYPDIPCSGWCQSSTKRVFDAIAAAAILIVFSPLLLLLGMLVRLSSPGPAIFCQKRVGRHGEEFTILKFRTMQHAVEGSKRSSHGDHRLTAPGKLLRKYKLDELPQLINVVRGDMSLVGPRPRLNGHHSGHHNGLHSPDTCFRPGLTGAATLAFASEELILRDIPQEFLEECHSRLISPRKLELDLKYMAGATFRSDIRLMWRTLLRADRYTDLRQLGDWQPPRSHEASRHAHQAPATDPIKASILSATAQPHGVESLSL